MDDREKTFSRPTQPNDASEQKNQTIQASIDINKGLINRFPSFPSI